MIGKLVETDGNNMNVYVEGEGGHTLVILAGSGIASPVLEYKALYSRLSDKYRVVVIEKFGYGYADVVGSERSFDTIVKQDRAALKCMGIDAPFVLCPHSMSGIEALMWAQDYPDEVEAIVGLDMAVPEAYDTFEERLERAKKAVGTVAFLKKSGLIKLMSDSMLSIPKTLTKEERKEYRKILCEKMGNPVIMNEASHIPAARDDVRAKPKPSIPMLLFVSNGKNTGDSKEVWQGFTRAYAKGMSNITIREVEANHALYNFEYKPMAEEIISFISYREDLL